MGNKLGQISRKAARDHIPTLFMLWAVLATCFGIQLYFSINRNLNDPIVHPIVPIIKDFTWVTLVAFTFYAIRENPFKFVLNSWLCIIYAIFTVILISSWIWQGAPIEHSWISFQKNFVLYGFGTIILTLALFRLMRPDEIINILITAIALSLIVSLALYFLHPVRSSDGRLYGTYGNPNSACFAAVMLFYFAFHQRCKGVTHWSTSSSGLLFIVVLLAVIVHLAGSLSGIAGQFLIYAVLAGMELVFRREKSVYAIRMLLLLGLSHLAVFILVGGGLALLGLDPFSIRRFHVFFDQGASPLTNETVTTRLNDWANVIVENQPVVQEQSQAQSAQKSDVMHSAGTLRLYDSVILTYYKNVFGIGIIIPLFPAVACLISFLRQSKDYSSRILFSLALALFFFNPLLQPQIIIFPTNFLFMTTFVLFLNRHWKV